MRSVDQHLNAVLTGVAPLAPLELGLLESRGCFVARDVIAPWPLPPFDTAGLDGYALIAADAARASRDNEVLLRVVDDVPAGYRATQPVLPGTAVRIKPGAPMPVGADCVVALTDTDGGMPTVKVRATTHPGHGVRLSGQELAQGQVIAPEGTHIGAREVALLAAAGIARVGVRPKPRVVVMTTGTELVEPGTPLVPGLIPDANGFMLTAAAEDSGALAYRTGPIPDEQTALTDALEDQLVRADLIVTAGGVTAGTYDTVRSVLSRLGAMDFTRVAMSPGMAQGHGHLGPDMIPIFTLPGNPAAAAVSFEVFVRPVIRRMLGHKQLFRTLTPARLSRDIDSPAGLRSYVFAVVGGPPEQAEVTPLPLVGVQSLARANALIVLPEETTLVPAGALVSIVRVTPEP